MHQLTKDEKNTVPEIEDLLIDIGARTKAEAEALVSLGDNAYFDSEYIEFGDGFIKAKAIDDREGNLVMLAPDYAIVLESTTAADLPDVGGYRQVCKTGGGAVVGFMDRGTVYDKSLFDLAFRLAKENSIPCQTKTMVAGGNDASAIHKAAGGVKTVAVSVPCRYIHSASCVAKKEDIDSVARLSRVLADTLAVL